MRKFALFSTISVVLLMASSPAIAQNSDTKNCLVLNNGLTTTGANFRSLTGIGTGTVISAITPYLANPGFRRAKEKSFFEVGIKDLVIISTEYGVYNQNNVPISTRPVQYFSTGLYFNKSFRVLQLNNSSVYLGAEPYLLYNYTGSTVDQIHYSFKAKSVSAKLNINARWEEWLTDYLFINGVVGVAPITYTRSMAEDEWSKEPLFTSQLSGTFSTYIQFTLGVKL